MPTCTPSLRNAKPTSRAEQMIYKNRNRWISPGSSKAVTSSCRYEFQCCAMSVSSSSISIFEPNASRASLSMALIWLLILRIRASSSISSRRILFTSRWLSGGSGLIFFFSPPSDLPGEPELDVPKLSRLHDRCLLCAFGPGMLLLYTGVRRAFERRETGMRDGRLETGVMLARDCGRGI